VTAAWAIGGLLVPWLAGAGLVAWLDRRRLNAMLVLGAGWLTGQALVMAGLYASLTILGEANARLWLAGLAMAAVVAWGGRVACCCRQRRSRDAASSTARRDDSGIGDSSLSPDATHLASDATHRANRIGGSRLGGRLILAVLFASLLAKLCIVSAAHAWVPSRSDDALTIWLYKAKVIAALDELPLDPSHDYYQAGSNPRYPPFVSLVAAWLPLLTGRWGESLTTLPWLLFYANLVLLTAGGLRLWLPVVPSWIGAYLVGSMPLIVVHAYRPGYADLILASYLAGAVVFLLIWRNGISAAQSASRAGAPEFCDDDRRLGLDRGRSTAMNGESPRRDGRLRYLIAAWAMAVAAACLKREGPPLAAIAVAAIVVPSGRLFRLMSWRGRLASGLLGAVGVVAVALLVDFTEQTEAAASIRYHPEVWRKLWQHLFAWSSFSLLFWLVVVGWLGLFLPAGRFARLPTFLLVLGLCAFQAGVFLFTEQSRFAMNDQTPSRLFMQLAPALVIALATAWADVFAPRSAPACSGA